MQVNKQSIAAAIAAVFSVALLASCGGGGDTTRHITEVVSFGDSLSDTGTYAPATTLTSGVKFTTNPASMWTEVVAASYNVQMSPNAFVRFNPALATNSSADISKNVVTTSTGTSYAQGSARVSAMSVSLVTGASAPSASPLITVGSVTVAPATASDVIVGYSINPSTGAPFAAKSGVPTALTAVSIKDQITNYLLTHNDKFTDNQVVLIQGGANDLFVALSTFQATGAMAPDPNYCGGTLYNAATDNIVTCAAKEMALQLQRLVSKGATHILYANLPDVGNTPEFVLLAAASPTVGAATKANVTLLSQGYNATVLGVLQALGIDSKITIFDTATFMTNTLASPPSGTVSTPNAKFACLGPASTSSITGVTSLGCASVANGGYGFATADAPRTYIFADGVHPTLLGHQLWGNAAATLANSKFPL